MQAYLGDGVGLIPDYHNKANIAIKPVTRIFWFPSAYKIYVYAILQFINHAITLYLKNNAHTLILKYPIAKKC